MSDSDFENRFLIWNFRKVFGKSDFQNLFSVVGSWKCCISVLDFVFQKDGLFFQKKYFRFLVSENFQSQYFRNRFWIFQIAIFQICRFRNFEKSVFPFLDWEIFKCWDLKSIVNVDTNFLFQISGFGFVFRNKIGFGCFQNHVSFFRFQEFLVLFNIVFKIDSEISNRFWNSRIADPLLKIISISDFVFRKSIFGF